MPRTSGSKSKKTARPAKERVRAVLTELARLYPDAACTLDHKGPLQLVVATILSAQCTDERVNKVTPALFARFPRAIDYAEADIAELEEMIRSTGFFRNKAKSIKGLGAKLVEEHNSRVPQTLEELVKLPGVGRKTANVVLGDAFDTPGITVDTHVGRLSRRLGFTSQKDAVKAEFELMEIIPQPEWTTFSHRMILHGRKVCLSRKPKCGECTLAALCPSAEL